MRSPLKDGGDRAPPRRDRYMTERLGKGEALSDEVAVGWPRKDLRRFKRGQGRGSSVVAAAFAGPEGHFCLGAERDWRHGAAPVERHAGGLLR